MGFSPCDYTKHRNAYRLSTRRFKIQDHDLGDESPLPVGKVKGEYCSERSRLDSSVGV